MSKHYSLIRSA